MKTERLKSLVLLLNRNGVEVTEVEALNQVFEIKDFKIKFSTLGKVCPPLEEVCVGSVEN